MMRILLACLMCEILPLSQALAIDGGPWGGGNGGVAVVGTYSGVFVPKRIDMGGGVFGIDDSLGLFTIGVPQTGLAGGTAAVFRNGIFYPGQILGSADPDSGKITGVINAFFLVTVAITDTERLVYEYDANGKFDKTKIIANLTGSSSVRIRGTATLTYRNTAADPAGDSGGPIEYRVRGFKQSNTATVTAPTPAPTG